MKYYRMTTLNVNEGASSSAGSHNELSSLLPTSSEPVINPNPETQQQNQYSKALRSEMILEHINDVFLSRVENRSRWRSRQYR